MKNILVLLSVAAIGFAVGCGDTRNEGDKAHGGLFRVDSFNDGDSTDIDTVVGVCDGGVLEDPPREKKSGQVTLSNLKIGTAAAPTDIRVERYTIDYYPLDGGGALTPLEYITSAIVPGDGVATINIEMVPLVTKGEFREFFQPITQTSTQDTFRYELEYEFVGFDEYDIEVRTKGSTVLTLGNYITCP